MRRSPAGRLPGHPASLGHGGGDGGVARWLARRAAWSDTEADAALAAGFTQSRIAAFTYDLHQFSGAMGLTLEFPLHLWTYLAARAGRRTGRSEHPGARRSQSRLGDAA